ncbi:MAG: hypothetical protein KJ955_07685 [Nanoarchaeota archaeon]|nr:hypothetical protein [Nanoarchaeota archaeon]
MQLPQPSLTLKMATYKFEDIARRDYNYLLSNVSLGTSRRTKELLLMQSVEGHAILGDGMFNIVMGTEWRRGKQRQKRRRFQFPETTIEDVIIALRQNPDLIKQERQEMINEATDFMRRLMAGEELTHYINRNGEPLFGINFLKDTRISNPAHVLAGAYIGGRMDKYIGWRQEAEKLYGVATGGGVCIGVNRKKAKEAGIKLEQLARNEHTEEEITALIAAGILCHDVGSSKDVISWYVRYKEGEGTSDDLAVLFAGTNYSYDAAIGLFIADAIDTWDKYVPFIHKDGQDEQLADEICAEEKSIAKKVKGFRLPPKENVLELIALIAEANYDIMTSSSQRYFLQKQKHAPQCAIENYIGYIRTGNQGRQMHIGHPKSRLSNYGMYKRFEEMKTYMHS